MEVSQEARWSTDLRKSLLHGARLNVSIQAVRIDVQCIYLVERGVRLACLLTSCMATNEGVLKVLRDCLKRCGFLDHAFVLLHSASDQIFVVNRSLLVAELHHNRHLRAFYVIGDSQCTSSPPDDLDKSLAAIFDILDVDRKHDDHDVMILHCPSSLAISGVALAGWLLEYTLVYCCGCPTDMEIFAHWSDANNNDVRSSTTPARQVEASAMDTTSLSDRPLFLFSAWLQKPSDKDQTYELMQFTIPVDLLDEVVQNVGLNDVDPEAVVDHIKAHYSRRFVNSDWHLFVKYERRSTGHITM